MFVIPVPTSGGIPGDGYKIKVAIFLELFKEFFLLFHNLCFASLSGCA
jgi:hypothetical protein